MLVQSFANVIESCVANHGSRNVTGYVTAIDDLCTEEAMRALDDAHRGSFAFLAFNGKTDRVVAEYVAGGSLAEDSGPHVFVLFTTQTAVTTPRRLSLGMLNDTVILDEGRQHPSYEYVRKLAPEIGSPPLPCVALFDRFADGAEPVLVGLGSAINADEIRALLRSVFSMASSHVGDRTNGRYAERLSADLAKAGINYVRSGRKSMREWLNSALYRARQNASTVVSILKLFA